STFTFPSGINTNNDKGQFSNRKKFTFRKKPWEHNSSNIPVAREPRLNQGNYRNHHNNKPQGPPPPAQKPSRHHHHQQHQEGPPPPAHMRPDHRHPQLPAPAAQNKVTLPLVFKKTT
ncbi:unnamed protein product, partial [Orchesella dallaii]